MKLGIGSKVYYNVRDYAEGFKKLKRHGYDCVDYNDLADMSSELYGLSDGELREFLESVASSARECGVEIWQMHALWPTVNLDKTEPDRKRTVEYFIRQLEAANYLGCRYFVFHPFMPFGHNEEGNYSFTFDVNLALIKTLIPYAMRWGVTLCIENMPFKNNPISKVSEIKRLVRTIDHPMVKVCLDVGHANIVSSDVAADVRLLGDDLATLHIHDNPGWCDAHALPYCGTVKWDEFLTALGEIGFDGCFNLETAIPAAMPEPYCEEMRSSLARLAREMADSVVPETKL